MARPFGKSRPLPTTSGPTRGAQRRNVSGRTYAGNMRWTEIAGSEPALGTVVHDRLIKPGVVPVGTTRRDGSARISGVEPLVMGGELWLSMMSTSAKVADLERDRRIQLHSIITGRVPGLEGRPRGG